MASHNTRAQSLPCRIVIPAPVIYAVRRIDLHLLAAVTIHDDVLYLLGKLLVWSIKREIILLGKSYDKSSSPALPVIKVPSARRDRTVVEREIRIVDAKLGIDISKSTDTRTLRTCAIRIIEREAPGRYFTI